MRRIANRRLAITGLILAMLCVAASQVTAKAPSAILKAVSVSAPGSADGLVLQIEGKYTFRASQVSAGLVFVDLKVVEACELAKSGVWTGSFLIFFNDTASTE